MEAREETLAETVAEEGTHEAELGVGITQTVTVAEVEEFVGNLDGDGIVVHLHATLLLEIVLTPDVMVASKEMHLDAHVGEFADLAQEACVAFGHHVPILVPEVEDVAKEVDG